MIAGNTPQQHSIPAYPDRSVLQAVIGATAAQRPDYAVGLDQDEQTLRASRPVRTARDELSAPKGCRQTPPINRRNQNSQVNSGAHWHGCWHNGYPVLSLRQIRDRLHRRGERSHKPARAY